MVCAVLEHSVGRSEQVLHRADAAQYRRFSLPRHTEAHQASASLTDGVLTVTIPTEEAAEEAPTKRVKIVPASKA